jgi:hypothetical protein
MVLSEVKIGRRYWYSNIAINIGTFSFHRKSEKSDFNLTLIKQEQCLLWDFLPFET